MSAKRITYCINCGGKKKYNVRTFTRKIYAKGVEFVYDHKIAFCSECGEEVYAPEVNDANDDAREEAYIKAQTAAYFDENDLA